MDPESIDLNIFEAEPADEYQQALDRYLSSHQLLDFIKCPWLYRKEVASLIADTDSPSYLIGRAACPHPRRPRRLRIPVLLGGPINPKTNKPFGSNNEGLAEWAYAQGKPVYRTPGGLTVDGQRWP
ncbi:MAG: hypothetical protein R3C45_18470 [Phycisphaerales bacterium]